MSFAEAMASTLSSITGVQIMDMDASLGAIIPIWILGSWLIVGLFGLMRASDRS